LTTYYVSQTPIRWDRILTGLELPETPIPRRFDTEVEMSLATEVQQFMTGQSSLDTVQEVDT